MSNIIKQVFISLICIIMLFSFFSNSFAINEVNNNQINAVSNNTNNVVNNTNTVSNTTSDVKPLTLQQQKDAVNENLNKANEQLAYVQNEFLRFKICKIKLMDMSLLSRKLI